jgi:hypothetical protein
MAEDKLAGAARTGALKTSRAIMFAALVDLLVIVPYAYWRLSSNRLALIIVMAVEGIGILTLFGLALHLRRRAS